MSFTSFTFTFLVKVHTFRHCSSFPKKSRLRLHFSGALVASLPKTRLMPRFQNICFRRLRAVQWQLRILSRSCGTAWTLYHVIHGLSSLFFRFLKLFSSVMVVSCLTRAAVTATLLSYHIFSLLSRLFSPFRVFPMCLASPEATCLVYHLSSPFVNPFLSKRIPYLPYKIQL